jgi:hypothetical protein
VLLTGRWGVVGPLHKTCSDLRIVFAAWPKSCRRSEAGGCQRGDGESRPQRQARDLGCHRAAVLTALDVIGYERPTHLRVRRARMVGLVLPELQNPIFPALAEVVGGALAQRGFNAVLCTRTGSTSEAEYVEMLLERQVSGVVFAGAQYAEADAPHRPSARSTRSAV